MPLSLIIVTGSDADFFELAAGCIRSIRDKPEGSTIPIGFYDLGCTTHQLDWLRQNVNLIRRPGWEFSFPGRDQAPSHLAGPLGRPYLTKYFPGFDLYLWLDADTWVQSWLAIELLIRGACRRQGMAIVPELDRGSRLQYGKLPAVWDVTRGWYAAAGVNAQWSNRLSSYPMLNVGAFALCSSAPHWDAWRERLTNFAQLGATLMTDQLALNYVTYAEGLMSRTELLPAWCNWTCHFGVPSWCAEQRCFVEPYLPHTPIGIVHLTGQKHRTVTVPATDGSQLEVTMRYPGGPTGNQ